MADRIRVSLLFLKHSKSLEASLVLDVKCLQCVPSADMRITNGLKNLTLDPYMCSLTYYLTDYGLVVLNSF